MVMQKQTDILHFQYHKIVFVFPVVPCCPAPRKPLLENALQFNVQSREDKRLGQIRPFEGDVPVKIIVLKKVHHNLPVERIDDPVFLHPAGHIEVEFLDQVHAAGPSPPPGPAGGILYVRIT